MSKRGRKKREEALEVPAEETDSQAEQAGPQAKPPSQGILANRKLIYAVVLVALVAVAAWRIGTMTVPESTDLTGRLINAGGAELSAQEVGDKLVDFLQSRLEISYPGISISLIGVEDYESVPGTYEVSVEITFQGETQPVAYYVTKDGSYMFANVVDLNEEMPVIESGDTAAEEGAILRDPPENPAIMTFYDSGLDICYEDGKPVIRMYTSSACGYCKWNKPMFIEVAQEYMDAGKIVAYLWEDGKNLLSDENEPIRAEDEALRQQFGFTGVPAFIFGCKYYRTGASFSSVENGTELEKAELRAVIEDLLAAS